MQMNLIYRKYIAISHTTLTHNIQAVFKFM